MERTCDDLVRKIERYIERIDSRMRMCQEDLKERSTPQDRITQAYDARYQAWLIETIPLTALSLLDMLKRELVSEIKDYLPPDYEGR